VKLETITLENFRQYYGRQNLEFAKDPNRNVTVIHGINGAGKTSFFLAMNWCLYGRKADDIKIIDSVGELISKEEVQHAKAGDTVSTSVDLTFTHNGSRYLVRRMLKGVKLENGSVRLEDNEDFVVMTTQPGDAQARRVGNPVGLINSVLPPNVREYFLFDGEKIDNFAKPESSEQVKQAIYLVLDIEVLERAQRHLDQLAREYRKLLKQSSGEELRTLLDKVEKARADRETAEKTHASLTQQISSAERKIDEIDERLRDIRGAQELQQRRDRLENDLDQRRSELKDLITRLAHTATTAHVIFAQSAIQKSLQILEEKRQRGEIPSGIRQQFVQDLIDRQICICGRPFSEHGPEEQKLLSLLEARMPGSIEDDILETNALLRTFVDSAQVKRDEINLSMRRRTELISIIETLEAELDDVSRQLQGSPLEEISKLEQKRREFRADIDRFNTEKGSLENQIETLTTTIKGLDKEIGKADKEQRQQQLLATKLDLAQRSADAIDQMHHAFADDMRQRIEVKTKEVFRSLVWKESHFQDVQLSPDFNLEVIDRYGKPARPELSAGERQVLSLAFIAAMSQVSEEEAPLVMDTPFGRLSSHHRNSITERLPKLAHQLVLFVTDEELREEAADNLRPHVGAEYRLNFDRLTSCTKIERV
jgi:DNA sulfur modification protein DndD